MLISEDFLCEVFTVRESSKSLIFTWFVVYGVI